jgi:hypothetical protein
VLCFVELERRRKEINSRTSRPQIERKRRQIEAHNVVTAPKLPSIRHGEGSHTASLKYAIKFTAALANAINGWSGTSVTTKSTAKFIIALGAGSGWQ